MQTRAQLNQAIKHYRLQCAQEIFRNVGYLEEEHVIELSEQYTLRILINWLATRCGFAPCANDMQPAHRSHLTNLESDYFSERAYPLHSHLDSKRDLALRDFGFALLEKSWPASTGLELIGEVYQHMLRAPLSRNAAGQPEIRFSKERSTTAEFYTPPWVVTYCFRQAACVWQTDKILDPSCGSGNFLLGALAESRFTGKQARQFVEQQLFGRDINARAVGLCRLSLFLAAAATWGVKFQDRHRSDLQRLAKSVTENIKVADQTLTCPEPEFDVVATNPPYVSYGSRGQSKIVSSQAALLRALYPQSSEYKIRLHSVFQDVCLRWTKPGGQVLLLLPDAFLTGSFYKKLRSMITSTADIVQIAELPSDTISDATVGNWCVAHYRKKSAPAAQKGAVRVARVEVGGKPIDETDIPFDVFVSQDCLRFNVVNSDEDTELIRHLIQFPLLREVLRGHTGIRSRRGQKTIVSGEQLAGQYKRGLVSGAQVLPFQTTWQGHWLNLQRDLLFPGGFDPAVVEQPKLLLRQTSDRIISACDRESFYHLNNIHSFAPRAGSGVEGLDAYAAVLNSRFFSYVYRLRSREKDRALAQIDIDMVESMPLPSLQGEAPLLSRAGKALQSTQTGGELRHQLENALERLVFDLFQLPRAIARHLGSADLPASSQARELILSVETNNLPYYSMNNY